jgi:hypothetical protein
MNIQVVICGEMQNLISTLRQSVNMAVIAVPARINRMTISFTFYSSHELV